MRKLVPLVLINLFFIFNGLNNFIDIVSVYEVIRLFFEIVIISILSLLLSWVLFQKSNKAIVYASMLTFFVLFGRLLFVTLKDNVFNHLKPSLFLLSLLVILFVVFILVKSSKDVGIEKFRRFLPFAFCGLLVFEILINVTTDKNDPFTLKQDVVLNTWSKNLPKPNIYVLLFDEYQGNYGLNKLGFKNEELTQFLDSLGFTVAEQPRSTYRTTIYSVPSLFRMDTLSLPSETAELTTRSAIKANLLLQQQNTFINYLEENNYDIQSYSLFSIGKSKPFVRIPIGTTWLELQHLKILPWWAQNDLFHAIPSNKFQKTVGTLHAKVVLYNEKGIAFAHKNIEAKKDKPKFVFNHILLPHPPVMLDSVGKERSMKDAMYEHNLSLPGLIPAYIAQIKYANVQIKNIITEALTKDPGCAIVLVSDHGCRPIFKDNPEVFNIQWAMKTPGGKTTVPQSQLHLVNTFRILLNEIAGQNLPMIQTLSKY
jgi:hypothetical protein